MRVAAAYHHHGARIFLGGAADELSAFAVAFSGNGAGVDNVNVTGIGERTQREATAAKILGNRLGFILRNLAAERVQANGIGLFRTDPPF